MPEHTSAPPHSRLRALSTTPTARSVAAAVLTIAALITAGNAIPAHAAESPPATVQGPGDRSSAPVQNSAVSSSNPRGAGSGTARPSLYEGLLVYASPDGSEWTVTSAFSRSISR